MSLLLTHINTCYLSENIEELEYLINKTKIDFDIIDVSESSIKKIIVQFKEYSYESCPTEFSEGGTLLYISNHLSYKTGSDLCIDKSRELESIFVEILNPKKTNVIVSCIYCHPHMDFDEFNDY